jgi:hypothetical protein
MAYLTLRPISFWRIELRFIFAWTGKKAFSEAPPDTRGGQDVEMFHICNANQPSEVNSGSGLAAYGCENE